MLPDRVSNPGSLTYESGVLPIALRGPAFCLSNTSNSKSNEHTLHYVNANLLRHFLDG